MRRLIRPIFRTLVVATLAFGLMQNARAQDYPSRTNVSIVTGLAAGSITDVIARYLANKLGQLSGQTFVVINKVGANAIIAGNEVVKAKPDGYTLLFAASSNYASNHLMYKDHPYNPRTDLLLLSTVTQFGFILLVNKDNPVNSIAELIEQLKKKGGGMYGTSSTNMLAAAEMFKAATGTGTQQVLYKSTADSVRDLMSNQVDFVLVDAAYALAQAKLGHVKPLAVTQAKRSVLAPDIPTMSEAGLPGYEVNGWMALAAPAHTPQPIVDRLQEWMQKIVAMPETQSFILNLGFEPFYTPPSQLNAFRDDQIEKWKKLVEISKIQVQ